jgi:hypothetical protein
MIVEVNLEVEPPTVTLLEPDDCARFHVSAIGRRDAAELGAALRTSGAGDGAGEEVVVNVDAVRRLAGRSEPGWDSDFSAMLDVARTRGWLSKEGSAIRAHVEWR